MARIQFPYGIKDVEEELAEELMEHYTGELTGFVRVGPKGYFFPHKYKEQAEDIYNIPVRDDDIYVVTYPRSGTTWTQELVWLLNNDLDFDTARRTPLSSRFPFLEFSILVHPAYERMMIEDNKASPEMLSTIRAATLAGAHKASAMSSPRLIKTHLPVSLLPPGLLDTARVVYVARDPRDAAVSHYHLSRLYRIQGAPDDFKTYWNYVTRGLHHYSPMLEHVKEAWDLRDHPNMLFLFYEELAQDLPSVIRRVAEFLGKEVTTEQVRQLNDHLSFNKFKDNSSISNVLLGKLDLLVKGEAPFIRKGKVGGWRDYFDSEMVAQADRWLRDGLADSDLRFPSWDVTEGPLKHNTNTINVEYIRSAHGRA